MKKMNEKQSRISFVGNGNQKLLQLLYRRFMSDQSTWSSTSTSTIRKRSLKEQQRYFAFVREKRSRKKDLKRTFSFSKFGMPMLRIPIKGVEYGGTWITPSIEKGIAWGMAGAPNASKLTQLLLATNRHPPLQQASKQCWWWCKKKYGMGVEKKKTVGAKKEERKATISKAQGSLLITRSTTTEAFLIY